MDIKKGISSWMDFLLWILLVCFFTTSFFLIISENQKNDLISNNKVLNQKIVQQKAEIAYYKHQLKQKDERIFRLEQALIIGYTKNHRLDGRSEMIPYDMLEPNKRNQ